MNPFNLSQWYAWWASWWPSLSECSLPDPPEVSADTSEPTTPAWFDTSDPYAPEPIDLEMRELLLHPLVFEQEHVWHQEPHDAWRDHHDHYLDADWHSHHEDSSWGSNWGGTSSWD